MSPEGWKVRIEDMHNPHSEGKCRRDIHMKGYDYSRAGAYFVTICTMDRGYLFGEIVDEEMVENHYPHVMLDAFVINPNHVHGIIVLNDVPDSAVGASLKPAPTGLGNAVGTGAPVRHGLPEIVRALKTFSARRINALRDLLRAYLAGSDSDLSRPQVPSV